MILCTLKKLIEDNNKTQSEISDATGITRPTLLSLIKNENKSIRYETINQLCKYFGINMSELLVYSPVNVELKEILIEEFPFSIYIPLNEGEMSYSVSIIYEIDNIEFEFDTNLNVSKKTNSLKPTNKVFFSSIIYEDELAKLNSKEFDLNFIKLYNDTIDLDSIIKNNLKEKGLNTDIYYKDYKVEIRTMERNNKTEKEIRNESLKSIEQAIENNDFSKDELSILKNILKNLDNLS
ncbi:XRE family transcriptional regulator [Staphylococcus epidermidis]|uniref:helix-turn-helix domain-containing protein n=1 Tax=Staphylococcus epidermidis TaxID=1282 RepID=UPI000E6A4884|nr:helix-turn-helix transcriptional regulator [Staphylococcus epidermidis]RIL56636.1 XRE family transcriptional regulator [Staphylococcus epidermidis]